jgi:toxin YoeB
VIKIWSDIAWNGYCQFFEKNQKNLIKSTHDLIKDIERNGTDKGKGQPESLKHELSGYWSRRIVLYTKLKKKNYILFNVELITNNNKFLRKRFQ